MPKQGCAISLPVVFTLAVAAIFITLAIGRTPAEWVYYVPLPPLGLLMLSGIYMYVLEFATKWRDARRSSI